MLGDWLPPALQPRVGQLRLVERAEDVQMLVERAEGDGAGRAPAAPCVLAQVCVGARATAPAARHAHNCTLAWARLPCPRRPRPLRRNARAVALPRIVVVGYAMAEQLGAAAPRFRAVVCDESHSLKSRATKRTKFLAQARGLSV